MNSGLVTILGIAALDFLKKRMGGEQVNAGLTAQPNPLPDGPIPFAGGEGSIVDDDVMTNIPEGSEGRRDLPGGYYVDSNGQVYSPSGFRTSWNWSTNKPMNTNGSGTDVTVSNPRTPLAIDGRDASKGSANPMKHRR